MITKEKLIEAGLDNEEVDLIMKAEKKGIGGLVLTMLAAFKAKDEGEKDWLSVLRNPDLNLKVVKGE